MIRNFVIKQLKFFYIEKKFTLFGDVLPVISSSMGQLWIWFVRLHALLLDRVVL